jgi:hypothetical protein
MQTADHKFVASYANVISDFQSQVASIQGASTDTGNGGTVTFVKGPNNSLYLLEVLSVSANTTTPGSGTASKAIYLSPVGTTNSTTAAATISAIKQMWPYLSDSSANAVLASTGKTYFNGIIIDPDAALSPVGSLAFKGMPSINGYIAGIKLDSNDTQLTALDQFNRGYNVNLSPNVVGGYSNSFNMDSEHIDQHELTGHTEYLINGPVNTYGNVRIGTETRNMYNTIGNDPSQGPVIGVQPKNYTVGVPKLWTSRDGRWSAGAQYTTLSYNPWLAFGGAWGQVTQTGNLDHTVRYNHGGFTTVVGGTYTTTNLTPGLITRVNDIYGIWGETGYRFDNNVGVYAGVKPVVVSGNIHAHLPTSIDNSGNIQYTGKTLAIQNQTTGYVRALWATEVNKKTVYRISGTVMSNGQSRIMNELRYSFD